MIDLAELSEIEIRDSYSFDDLLEMVIEYQKQIKEFEEKEKSILMSMCSASLEIESAMRNITSIKKILGVEEVQL